MEFITDEMITAAVKRLEGKYEFCTSDVLEVLSNEHPTEFSRELDAAEQVREKLALEVTQVLRRRARQGKMEQINQGPCDQSLYLNARWRTPAPGFDIVR